MGKIKNYMMKKVMDHKMKDADPQQRQMIEKLMNENPELLEKIQKEIKQEMNNGKDQMAASMVVMKKHQSEIQKIMQQ